MRPTFFAILVTATILAQARNLQDVANCAAVHIFVARGSNEAAPYGGQLQPLMNSIQGELNATAEGIEYRASLRKYADSVREGTMQTQRQIQAYTTRCPTSKIIVLGYSQGAQVTGDALCGGDANGEGPISAPLASELRAHGINTIKF